MAELSSIISPLSWGGRGGEGGGVKCQELGDMRVAWMVLYGGQLWFNVLAEQLRGVYFQPGPEDACEQLGVLSPKAHQNTLIVICLKQRERNRVKERARREETELFLNFQNPSSLPHD